MARVLDIALSGPRAYHGDLRPFPWVNGTARRSIGPAEIDRAVALIWRTWGLLVAIALLVALV